MKQITNVLFITTVALLFASCNKEEKAVTEFVKKQMKSPSTFSLVDITKTDVEEVITYDTTYHIVDAIGKEFDSPINNTISGRFALVSEYVYDSIIVEKVVTPAHASYHVEYDAQNSFGATVRDYMVVCCQNGELLNSDDFYRISIENKQMEKKCAESGKVANNSIGIKDECWIEGFLLEF